MKQAQAEVRNSSLLPEINEILRLASQGVAFAPTTPGMTRSDWTGWQDIATSDPAKLKEWINLGYGLVAVARREGCFLLDIDDPDKCKALGMSDPGVSYWVSTPSGGSHGYGLHDDVTRSLGNLIVVYGPDDIAKAKAEKRQPRKILELKLHHQSVAAPTSHRFGQKNKKDGMYTPRSANDLGTGIDGDFVAWLEKHGVKSGSSKPGKAPDFADGFEMDGFLDAYGCAEAKQGSVNGELHVVPEECPNCGKPCGGSTVAATKCKFGFGGGYWWYRCHMCNATRKELEEKFGAYEGEIFASDGEILVGFGEDDVVKIGSTAEDAAAHLNDDPETPAVRNNSNGEVRVTAKLNLIRMSEVKQTEMGWLWPDKIPAGKMTLFAGKPDNGKSLSSLDLIARITTGADFADAAKNTLGPRDVLIACTEDDLSDTVAPRLTAAGADLSRVYHLEGVTQTDNIEGETKTFDTRFSLKEHTEALRNRLKKLPGVALVVFDPLPAFYGDVDANKDKDIRPVLETLAEVCAEAKVAFVGVIHHNKRGDVDALQKILGASSVAGVVRAVWGFSRDPDNKGEFFMSLVKNNLAEKRNGLKFRVVSVDVPTGKAPRIDWIGETEEDANEILDRERNKARQSREDTKHTAARLFLKQQLEGGRFVKSSSVYEKAEAEDISRTTLKRAMRELGVQHNKRPDGWWMILPVAEPTLTDNGEAL